MSLHADSKTLLRHKVPLSQYTTMQVGGAAEHFAEPVSEEDLLATLEYARHHRLPYLALGKGSNVIFPDEGYPGLVISLLQFQKNRILFDRDTWQVRASAGVHLYKFVLACRDRGFGGAEFLASIPGTIGGALVMNAGYSRFPGDTCEIANLAMEVTLLTPEGERKTLTRDEIGFAYRKTNLQDGGFVTEGKFQLFPKPPGEIEREIRACFDYRNRKQDLKHPSSGSMFKNPPAPLPAAGRLIDELGLKGVRIGGVMVSPKHGNYFINVGNATGSDVIRLIELIQEKVFHAAQIRLEPEVRIITKP